MDHMLKPLSLKLQYGINDISYTSIDLTLLVYTIASKLGVWFLVGISYTAQLVVLLESYK
jgi:hypothetical protein